MSTPDMHVPDAHAIVRRAPAKVNLCLHVLGKRADGLHALDSLVGFCTLGDILGAAPADRLALHATGRFAGALPASGRNLVMRAARRLKHSCGLPSSTGARMAIRKNLPVAAGLGGGSSDAAASLRLLAELWGVSPGESALCALGAGLGADVPACLFGRTAWTGGAGERIAPAPGLPKCAILLVNPNAPLPTAHVFGALARPDNPPLPERPESFPGFEALRRYLAATRNDLEAPARRLVPDIERALQLLREAALAPFARMSGSGATCFGLYPDRGAAEDGRRAIAQARPDWWVAVADMLA